MARAELYPWDMDVEWSVYKFVSVYGIVEKDKREEWTVRERTRKVVFSFSSTVEAMHMEACCLKEGCMGRLIPIPRQITAGCGLAWSAPWEEKKQLEQVILKQGIEVEGIYDLML